MFSKRGKLHQAARPLPCKIQEERAEGGVHRHASIAAPPASAPCSLPAITSRRFHPHCIAAHVARPSKPRPCTPFQGPEWIFGGHAASVYTLRKTSGPDEQKSRPFPMILPRGGGGGDVDVLR